MNIVKRFGAATIVSVALATAGTAAAAPASAQPAVATPVATTGSALTDILVAPVLFPMGFLVLALCGPTPQPDCLMAQIYGSAASGSGVH